MYLLDTDICIAMLRGHSRLAARRNALSPLTPLYTTVINVAELLYGARLAPHPSREEQRVETLLRGLWLLPLALDIVRAFVEAKDRLRRGGQLIPDNDLFIAAVALTYSLTLVSHNTRHFQRVEGLLLEDWLQ